MGLDIQLFRYSTVANYIISYGKEVCFDSRTTRLTNGALKRKSRIRCN
jgi:hypothetical protein